MNDRIGPWRGLSMGGARMTRADHPGQPRQVLAHRALQRRQPSRRMIPRLSADPSSFKQKVKVLFVSYGSKENTAAAEGEPRGAGKAGHQEHLLRKSPNTAHEWQTWQRSLYCQFASLLFQDESGLRDPRRFRQRLLDQEQAMMRPPISPGGWPRSRSRLRLQPELAALALLAWPVRRSAVREPAGPTYGFVGVLLLASCQQRREPDRGQLRPDRPGVRARAIPPIWPSGSRCAMIAERRRGENAAQGQGPARRRPAEGVRRGPGAVDRLRGEGGPWPARAGRSGIGCESP